MAMSSILRAYVRSLLLKEGAVSASASYMKKEKVREELQQMVTARVASGDIASQKDLDDFFRTVNMASGALKAIPFEVFSQLGRPKSKKGQVA